MSKGIQARKNQLVKSGHLHDSVIIGKKNKSIWTQSNEVVYSLRAIGWFSLITASFGTSLGIAINSGASMHTIIGFILLLSIPAVVTIGFSWHAISQIALYGGSEKFLRHVLQTEFKDFIKKPSLWNIISPLPTSLKSPISTFINYNSIADSYDLIEDRLSHAGIIVRSTEFYGKRHTFNQLLNNMEQQYSIQGKMIESDDSIAVSEM